MSSGVADPVLGGGGLAGDGDRPLGDRDGEGGLLGPLEGEGGQGGRLGGPPFAESIGDGGRSGSLGVTFVTDPSPSSEGTSNEGGLSNPEFDAPASTPASVNVPVLPLNPLF